MNIEEDIRQLVAQSVNASIKALLSRIERLERSIPPDKCSFDENEMFLVYNTWLRSRESFPTPLEAFREGWKAGKKQTLR